MCIEDVGIKKPEFANVMTDETFNLKLRNYLDSLEGEELDGRNYSPLWKNFIHNFRYENISNLDKYISDTSRGYAYLPKSNTNSLINFLNKLLGLMFCNLERFTPPLAHLYLVIIRKFFSVFGIKKDKLLKYFDPRTVSTGKYLRKNGIDIKKYYEKVSTSVSVSENYNTNKIFYYFDLLLKRSPGFKDKESIVEVGAGTANIPILFALYMDKLNYIIIDLPEMLVAGAYEIHKYIKDSNIAFGNEIDDKIQFLSEGKNFFLLTPTQANKIPSDSLDLAINMESFAEMHQEVADAYIDIFYKVLKPGGLIYLVNRESRVLEKNDNIAKVTTFWKYPLKKSDKVTIFDYCKFRKSVRVKTTDNLVYLANKA